MVFKQTFSTLEKQMENGNKIEMRKQQIESK